MISLDIKITADSYNPLAMNYNSEYFITISHSKHSSAPAKIEQLIVTKISESSNNQLLELKPKTANWLTQYKFNYIFDDFIQLAYINIQLDIQTLLFNVPFLKLVIIAQVIKFQSETYCIISVQNAILS
ncbi:Hypothetical_protein [Hexamita inflata]|uniref:Hypothetical_protein n=1 Tax=Hexamita inflata TaxID=28002 RepID=A0AA86TGL6_9EUKA|nr:Hypothetical protein HINF_LOCUS5639 [Hexamita inflata]